MSDRTDQSEDRAIPQGVEVLLKKASVDKEFREALLDKRADAAQLIGLRLFPAEAAMLASIPRDQLEQMTVRTKVKPSNRRVFLGTSAALMLAAIGVVVCGRIVENKFRSLSHGLRPAMPSDYEPHVTETPDDPNTADSDDAANKL